MDITIYILTPFQCILLMQETISSKQTFNLNSRRVRLFHKFDLHKVSFKFFKMMSMPPPGHGQQPPELTRQDIRKIEKSMRRPEFMGLLNQYMVEISDPKNKKQYDDWLRQMQKQNELPKHMKLIQPTPEFCVKTTLNSIKNKQHEMKFFINMCSSPDIEKPGFEPITNDKGETGQNWKIPNSMGKIRYDQDKKGAVCNTVDAVFNPDVFLLAHNKSFQSMIIIIALDTAARQLGERKETLSKDYVVLQNVKCKGGEPALLPVRSIDGRLVNKGEGEERGIEGRETKLQKQISQKKVEYDKEKNQKAKEKEKEEEQMKKLEQQLQQQSGPPQSDSKGPARPKYNTIYTYAVDYGDYMEGGVSQKQKKKRPTTFAIEFKLPRVDNFSEIKTLDVSQNKLVMDAGEKYFIDLDFAELKINFKLISNESKAKFDKKKKTLRINFPIDKSSLKEQEEQVKPTEQDKQEQPVETNPVEQETWKDKNKLLEMSQNSVSLQFVKPQQIKPNEKVFVQQIDEDDIKDQPAQQTKKIEVQPSPQYKPLNYKFQETEKNAFVIANLPKYKKEDVQANVVDNNVIVKWNKPQGPEYLLLRLTKTDYTNVNINFVVDYVVVRVDKTVKGFWQKQSVLDNTGTKEQVEKQCEELLEKKRKELEQIRTVAVLKQIPKDQPEARSNDIRQNRKEQQQVQEEKKPKEQQSLPAAQIKLEKAKEVVLDSRPKPKNIQFIKFNIDLLNALD